MRLLHYSGGDLVLNGNVLDIVDTGGMQNNSTYPLFAFFADDGVTPVAHGLSGGLTLGTVPGGLKDIVLDYSSDPSMILLQVIPEPATLALLLGGGALALRRRQR
ncbi:MAG: hypothetical protein BWZ02_03232 [Lentisphaerae bacterium ADurb.BinA184]|nr:MAG: hypothetical protein BWZ02_03232 [Lentisphaerae bacterium ADurb.BinA184]